MGKRTRKASISEFPILDSLGLYAASTKGDGNCLFRALSDQVYGDETHHREIRQKVVEYVNEHGDNFSAFVGEFGETFEQYISRLSQDGVYGGHIEIVGFAERFNTQVVIYQAETVYIVKPSANSKPQDHAKDSASVHIAYHTWEHYSSVRQTGGPQSGPVNIDIPQISDLPASFEDGGSTSDPVPPWKIDIVMKSVPDASEEKVVEMLRVKDYDAVIEELIMQDLEGGDAPDKTNDTGDSEARENPKTNVESHAGSHHEECSTPQTKNNGRTAQSETSGSSDALETASKKPDSASHRQEARRRRYEKKERVRKKKEKSRHELTGSGSLDAKSGSKESSSVDAHRIIHI